jgi:adenine deaminase
VPATTFETAGATLDAVAVTRLLERDDIKYLSEMMNFPGVLFKDAEVMQKIGVAHALGKPVDGHAPGLRGDAAQQYINAGISTDHECFTYDEALDKLQRGMKVLIREGSAAKNFDALIPLLHDWSDSMMFCSDDKHPDSLEIGHINLLCARAVAAGIDVFNVLQAACINPVLHYKLDVGLLKIGDAADFILVKDLRHFKILETYVNGELVSKDGASFIKKVVEENAAAMNRFDCRNMTAIDFEKPYQQEVMIPVIEALDGQLITNRLEIAPLVKEGKMVPDTTNDILKIAVINRYFSAPVVVAFIRNFGLQKGAIASTVAHDSHNIVVVGCDDESMARAANLVIEASGGVSATDGILDHVLGLPVSGLMSASDGYEVAKQYTAIDRFTKDELGATLASPFMTLSFMALLVIPHLKLSDKGLFDGDTFSFVS